MKVANKERAAKLEEEKLQKQLESQDPKAAQKMLEEEAAAAKVEPSETPKQEILQELTQVIAEVAVVSTDSVAVVEESWQGDTLPPDADLNTKEVEAVPITETETITEEEDEKEIDPYLQYGGAYYEDSKNNSDFSYIQFTEMPKFTPAHKGLVAKYLTNDVFQKLKNVKTSKGYTLSNVITAGVVAPHLEIGVTAGDEESWELFKDLLYPIVSDWHGVEIGTMTNSSDIDPSKLVVDETVKSMIEHSVISTKIYAVRNVSGYSLPAGTTEAERASVEEALKGVVTSLTGENAGSYYPLTSIDNELSEELNTRKLLFEIPSATSKLTASGNHRRCFLIIEGYDLLSLGAARSWPNNRGIFVDSTLSVAAWINEEDHVRVIAQQEGGDVASTFARFAKFMTAVNEAAESKGLKFMHSERLGYLCTCPSELGTALKVTMTVHLPEINKIMQIRKKIDLDNIVKVCDIFAIDVDGSNGLLSAAEGDNFLISNSQRLGVTEVALTQKVINGVYRLVELDKMLAKGTTSEMISAFIDNDFKEPTTPESKSTPFGPRVTPAYRNSTLTPLSRVQR